PEVGRIIDVQDLPSTLNLVFLSNSRKSQNPLYIEGRRLIIEQYIAQYCTVKHHRASATQI
ncbi:hypothetical protein, partial [Pseudomonas sp.]|uniref:hypothetical protein n=1 Tax=Pseudomonas sp. TaxID=306 RepID=UPI003FD85D2E